MSLDPRGLEFNWKNGAEALRVINLLFLGTIAIWAWRERLIMDKSWKDSQDVGPIGLSILYNKIFYYFGCCTSIQALYLGIFKELDRLYYLVLSLFLFIEAEIEGGERSSKNLSALSWVKCGGQLERNMRKSEKKVTTVFSEVRVRGQVSKDSAKFSRA